MSWMVEGIGFFGDGRFSKNLNFYFLNMYVVDNCVKSVVGWW